jgi:Tol biopolymer transport system component
MKRWVLCSLAVTLSLLLLAPLAQSASQIQLTTSTAKDQHPTWTADGQYILFESNRDGGWHIYRVPAAGGTVQQLTFGPLDQLNPEV